MSIEFKSTDHHTIKRELEDKDFRSYAKRLAYAWVSTYISKGQFQPSFPIKDLIAAGRVWGIIGAELGYDLFTWLDESDFAGNVPKEIQDRYKDRYLTNDAYINALPENSPRRYSYEQYFIYLEMCKLFGVNPDIDDDLQSF